MVEILTALALVMVIEGLLPFISPDSYKRTVAQMLKIPSSTLRIVGLGSMLAGVVILYFARNFG